MDESIPCISVKLLLQFGVFVQAANESIAAKRKSDFFINRYLGFTIPAQEYKMIFILPKLIVRAFQLKIVCCFFP